MKAKFIALFMILIPFVQAQDELKIARKTESLFELYTKQEKKFDKLAAARTKLYRSIVSAIGRKNHAELPELLRKFDSNTDQLRPLVTSLLADGKYLKAAHSAVHGRVIQNNEAEDQRQIDAVNRIVKKAGSISLADDEIVRKARKIIDDQARNSPGFLFH